MEVHWRTEKGEDIIFTEKSTLVEIKKSVPYAVRMAIARYYGQTDFTMWKYKVLATAPENSPINRVQTIFVPVLLDALQRLIDGEIQVENILHPDFT